MLATSTACKTNTMKCKRLNCVFIIQLNVVFAMTFNWLFYYMHNLVKLNLCNCPKHKLLQIRHSYTQHCIDCFSFVSLTWYSKRFTKKPNIIMSTAPAQPHRQRGKLQQHSKTLFLYTKSISIHFSQCFQLQLLVKQYYEM